jgi:hypothetical protein
VIKVMRLNREGEGGEDPLVRQPSEPKDAPNLLIGLGVAPKISNPTPYDENRSLL